MKKLLFTILISLPAICVHSQIKNESFEIKHEKSADLPANWGMRLVEGYQVSLDSGTKHSGKSSLKLVGTDKIKSGGFQNVSQTVNYAPNAIKSVRISGFVKLDSVKGSVAFWCQIWSKDKMIGFQNIQSQQETLAGTKDWKQYSLNLTVPSETERLLFGVYLAGTGTAWLDDFKLGEIETSKIPPASEVVKYVDEFRNIVKVSSIFKDSLDWPSIDRDMKNLSMGLKTVDEAKAVTAYLLQKLKEAGDDHSVLMLKSAAQEYASRNTNPDQVESKLLQNNIGYISVPGFRSLNKKTMDSFANNIQQRIKRLDVAHDIKGWIVDLRDNTGGNMYPMIAGLGPLLGSGNLGYFVSPNGNKKKLTPWSYSATPKKPTTMGIQLDSLYELEGKNAKIAVLIGPHTGSSGEMTAISFIGAPNTKLFGEPTAGYTSANSGFKLSNGDYLYLAVSYTADRNKKEYRSKIQPDVFLKAKKGEDTAIESALQWINETSN
ncbi:S41 family peptidase [Pedobacter endophyticus]|uniref:Tail specific protease domain-containing protein n=1 Tax=Pedobacter endophyticus TaxID=2789740 RepID=A0A7S9KZG9_9SPHI|nr:S41 family peptidase [Pedobacter endophyticus]QPH39675.1 hypothetical protein IZT61_22010 [Pedobacter endophyticus]